MEEYKIYDNVILLYFDIINILKENEDSYLQFSVIVNKNYFIKIDDVNYLFPLMVKTGFNNFNLQNLYESINYIPLIHLNVSTEKNVIIKYNNSKSIYNINIDDNIKNALIVVKSLISEKDEIIDTKIIDLLRKYDIQFINEEGKLIFNDEKFILTNKNYAELNDKYMNYKLIYPKYGEYHYSSVNKETIFSIGFINGNNDDIIIIKNSSLMRFYDII